MLTKISRKISSLFYIASNPRFIKLRNQGVNLEVFQSLDKSWIRDIDIKTVIDIGANIGQFSLMAHTLFPKSYIYAFEPIPECFATLMQKMRGNKKFTAFNIGIGEEEGELEFEENQFSASSSFLKISNTHTKLFPETQNTKRIKLKIDKLDNFKSKLTIIDPLLIKIDVQGYEDLVLKGGINIVKSAKIIIIEASFEPLYKNQSLFREVFFYLDSLDFAFKGVIHQLYSPDNGRILQADCIFIKE